MSSRYYLNRYFTKNDDFNREAIHIIVKLPATASSNEIDKLCLRDRRKDMTSWPSDEKLKALYLEKIRKEREINVCILKTIKLYLFK
jgi:hypothetical protein